MTTPVPIAAAFSEEAVLMELPVGSKAEVLEAMVGHAITSRGLPRNRNGKE